MKKHLQNPDVPMEVSPETQDKNEASLDQEIEEDIDSVQEPPEETSPEYITPELPAEVLATMTEKEKQVYYAMIFQRNEMPTNKTSYKEEYPLLTPDRDLYIPPKRKSLVENTQIKKTFATEGFSETFFLTHITVKYMDLFVKIETLPSKQKEILSFWQMVGRALFVGIPNLFSVYFGILVSQY